MIQSTGYVVCNNEAIWSVGATADSAWAAFEAEMAAQHTVIVPDDQDAPEDGRDWIRESGYQVRAATAALIQQAQDEGGDISWRVLAGIACTHAEAGEGTEFEVEHGVWTAYGNDGRVTTDKIEAGFYRSEYPAGYGWRARRVDNVHGGDYGWGPLADDSDAAIAALKLEYAENAEEE